MSNADLLLEATNNAKELLRLAGSIKGFSLWEKSIIALNVSLAVAGLALAPPTGGLSLGLTVISTLLLAADIGKKARDLSADAALREQISALETRNALLLAEIRRRLP